MLLEGLLGQAKSLLQLDKRDRSRLCVLEALRLRSPGESLGGIGAEIEEVVPEAFAKRSA